MSDNLIHPTAIISNKASLGVNVKIGPYAVIENNTNIGDSCTVGPHVVIHPHTTLGEACSVHTGAILGDIPQDLGFDPSSKSYVSIGNNCTIREGVTIHRGTKENTSTVLGNDCYLMAFSHVAHNCKVGNRVILVNAALLAGHVEVDDGAFIGGGCGVHQFVKIGKGAILGGLGAFTKDVPPYCLTKSSSLNGVTGLNNVGLKRVGFSPAERKEIKEAFHQLYRSGLNASQAKEQLKKAYPGGPASEFWKFLERSDRGICPLLTD